MRISEAVSELLVATRAAGCSDETVDLYVRKLRPLIKYLDDKPVGGVSNRGLREPPIRGIGSQQFAAKGGHSGRTSGPVGSSWGRLDEWVFKVQSVDLSTGALCDGSGSGGAGGGV